MAEFWNNFPDVELSPLELAQKKWAIAREDHGKVIESYLKQATQEEEPIQEEKLQSYIQGIKDSETQVNELMRKWIALQPYCTEILLKYLLFNADEFEQLLKEKKPPVSTTTTTEPEQVSPMKRLQIESPTSTDDTM